MRHLPLGTLGRVLLLWLVCHEVRASDGAEDAAVTCSAGVIAQENVWTGIGPGGVGVSANSIRSVAVASNGDVVLAGSSTNGTFDDALVLRVAASTSSVVWAWTWGSAAFTDSFVAVVLADNGDVVAVGLTHLSVSNSDVLVMRLDGGSGNVVWARTWGGASYDEANAVAMTAYGDIVVAGATSSFGSGSTDLLVMRLHGGNCSVVWAGAWGSSFGSPGQETAYAVTMAANGDAVVADYVADGAGNQRDALMLRLHGGNGSVVWARAWDRGCCWICMNLQLSQVLSTAANWYGCAVAGA
jgi:hypothetical protein